MLGIPQSRPLVLERVYDAGSKLTPSNRQSIPALLDIPSMTEGLYGFELGAEWMLYCPDQRRITRIDESRSLDVLDGNSNDRCDLSDSICFLELLVTLPLSCHGSWYTEYLSDILKWYIGPHAAICAIPNSFLPKSLTTKKRGLITA